MVRKTGGLNDTVFDVDDDSERAAAAGYVPNGFSFEGMDAAGIDYALNRFHRISYVGTAAAHVGSMLCKVGTAFDVHRAARPWVDTALRHAVCRVRRVDAGRFWAAICAQL